MDLHSVMEMFLLEMATRQRNSSCTTVDRVMFLLEPLLPNVSRALVIGCFRAMEREKYGRYMCGRKGHPSRFAWAPGVSSHAYERYFSKAA